MFEEHTEVDRAVANEILLYPEVAQFIKSQTAKAEKMHDDSIEWRAYEFRKKKMEYLDSLNMDDDKYCEFGLVLSNEQKGYLMLEAVYNNLFTEFDFAKYEKLNDELEMLDIDGCDRIKNDTRPKPQ